MLDRGLLALGFPLNTTEYLLFLREEFWHLAPLSVPVRLFRISIGWTLALPFLQRLPLFEISFFLPYRFLEVKAHAFLYVPFPTFLPSPLERVECSNLITFVSPSHKFVE